MQDSGQDLVNSLNLIPRETDHFHGIGYSFEISPIVDGGLERERTNVGEGWRQITERKQRQS